MFIHFLTVWHSDNGFHHIINNMMPCRARLVLGLVITFCGSIISTFIQATQSGHLSVGRCSVYWQWFWPPLGKKRRVLRSSGPCYQDYWHSGLLSASLIGSSPRLLKGQRGWAPSRQTSRFIRKSTSSVIDVNLIWWVESQHSITQSAVFMWNAILVNCVCYSAPPPTPPPYLVISFLLTAAVQVHVGGSVQLADDNAVPRQQFCCGVWHVVK